MASQERPVSVVIFGALNLVFGIIGFLGLIGSAAILFSVDPTNPMYSILQSSEFYRAWLWGASVIGLFATFVLLAAGIGLLLSKNWGRLLSMGYAIYAIVMGIAGGVVSWIYVTAPLLDKMSASSGPEVYGAIGGAIGGTIGSLAGLLYPIAILVFMTRRRVVEYLQRAV